MTGSVATDQPTLVDRLLAYMQQRFPREFEICLLSAQNDELQAKVTLYESIPETSEIVDGVEYKSTQDSWTVMPDAKGVGVEPQVQPEEAQPQLDFGEPAPP